MHTQNSTEDGPFVLLGCPIKPNLRADRVVCAPVLAERRLSALRWWSRERRRLCSILQAARFAFGCARAYGSAVRRFAPVLVVRLKPDPYETGLG